MVSTLVPSMVRRSIQPLQEVLAQMGPRQDPNGIEDLFDACSFLAFLLVELWKRNCDTMQAGVERETMLAKLKETAAVFDASLALLDQAEVQARTRTTSERLEALSLDRQHIQKLRDKVVEVLCWLEQPMPPIDPSTLDTKGPFKSLDEVLASL